MTTDIKNYINSLYLKDEEDPRTTLSTILKYHNSIDDQDFTVSKYIYYVITTYDLHINDFYDKTFTILNNNNIMETDFLESILSNRNISTEIINKFLLRILELSLEIRTYDLKKILILVLNLFKSNSILIKNQEIKKYILIYNESIDEISSICKKILQMY